MLRGAVTAFERMALEQADGPALRWGGREVALYRACPFSAAANYYLAARLAWSAPFLPTAPEAPHLSARALQMQSRAARAYPEAAAGVGRPHPLDAGAERARTARADAHLTGASVNEDAALRPTPRKSSGSFQYLLLNNRARFIHKTSRPEPGQLRHAPLAGARQSAWTGE